MSRSHIRQQRLDRIYSALCAVAEAGGPCPDNSELAEIAMLGQPQNVAGYLHDLEDDGLILVHRKSPSRYIKILATEKVTDWSKTIGRPLSLSRVRGNQRTTRVDGVQVQVGSFRGDLPADRYVDRTPCPRCAARADIGCAHRGSSPLRPAIVGARANEPLDGALSAYARAAGLPA